MGLMKAEASMARAEPQAGVGWAMAWLGTTLARRIAIGIATLFALRLIVLYFGNSAWSVDFPVFYTAAEIYLRGETFILFDNAVFNVIPKADSDMRWLYPAHALFLYWPLNLMPIETAYVVKGLVTWSLFIIAAIWLLRTVVPEAPAALYLLLCAGPACFWPQLMGHPTLFWSAGLMAAMALRERGRPVAAGMIIGLLTYKLTLGLLVAVALFAARDWRGVIAASATAIGLGALATLSVGIDYWPALFFKMLEHIERFGVSDNPFAMFYRHVGPQGLTASLGGSLAAASVAQAITTLICMAVIWVIWADPRVGARLRIAILFALIPVAAPAIWFYDAAPMAVGAVFFVAAGAVPATLAGVAVLLLLYINVLIPFLFDQSAGLACIPAAIGAIWLALRARAQLPDTPAGILSAATDAPRLQQPANAQ